MSGAIIAGGANERFAGEPKGLRIVGGARIIDRVASALRAVTPRIVLIANDPDAERWIPGVDVVRDQRSERGSVVGVHSAVAAVPKDGIVLVVAWDMPFVNAELLALLATRVRDGASAAVPEGPGGPEPFCAAYTPACLPEIERAIARREFRMSTVLGALPNVARITETEVRRFGDPARLFFNVNTVADLAAAEGMAARV